jgi:hypothetical protein
MAAVWRCGAIAQQPLLQSVSFMLLGRPPCPTHKEVAYMSTEPSHPQSSTSWDLRMAVVLLALVVGLLITGAAIYLALVHPTLAQPLGVGAAVLSALVSLVGLVARAIRR